MPPRPFAHLLAVLGGGLVGTSVRLTLDLVIPHDDHQFPVSTLIINIVGSFVLGLLVSGLWRRNVPSIVKAAVGPGVLGSFTTFSAVVLSVVLLVRADPSEWALAVLYLVLTLVLGFGAALLGVRLGGRLGLRSALGEHPEATG